MLLPNLNLCACLPIYLLSVGSLPFFLSVPFSWRGMREEAKEGERGVRKSNMKNREMEKRGEVMEEKG